MSSELIILCPSNANNSCVGFIGVSVQQLEAIKLAVERSVISRVYMYAMFPNSDGDISRDE